MNSQYISDRDAREAEERYLRKGNYRCDKAPKEKGAHTFVCIREDGLVSYYKCMYCEKPRVTKWRWLPDGNALRPKETIESILAHVEQICLRDAQRAA